MNAVSRITLGAYDLREIPPAGGARPLFPHPSIKVPISCAGRCRLLEFDLFVEKGRSFFANTGVLCPLEASLDSAELVQRDVESQLVLSD